jgi:hypothetical protein
VGRKQQRQLFQYRRQILRAIRSHTNADTDGYVHSNSNTYCNGYGYCYTGSESNANAHGDINADCDRDANADPYPHGHSNSHPSRYNQCGNERCKFFCYTQWLS